MQVTRSNLKKNYLRVIYSTTGFGYPDIYANQLLPQHERPGRGFWEYYDENTLEKVVQNLTKLTINKGITCLIGMSVLKKKPDLNQNVLFNRVVEKKKISEQFSRKYNLNNTEESLENFEEVIHSNRKNSVGEIDWEFVMQASIFFWNILFEIKEEYGSGIQTLIKSLYITRSR